MLTFLVGFSGYSQTTYVSDTTERQNITSYNQTFTFSFTGIPSGGWGNGTIIVYFRGDFGDYSEYITVTDENSTYLGEAGPYSSNYDCSPLDSTYLSFDAGQISSWLSDSQVDFNLTISSSVDLGVCSENFIQCKLIYNYCAAGTPQEFAHFSLTDSTFCNHDGERTFTGTPAGGVFSGAGIANNIFNPTNLSAGNYTITYTAEDLTGCITTYSKTVKILKSPVANDLIVCPESPAELTVSGLGTYVWFNDPELTSVIDTGIVVFSQPITETTNFYVAQLQTASSFLVDSISVYDSLVVDINATAGDDRGGIAITPDYVYCVGDNYTVRANASDLSNQVSLPKRDGIFSDLATGHLYTFWNTATNSAPDYDVNWQFTFNAIRTLDTDLNFGDEILELETPVSAAEYSLILAGKGFVGLASPVNGHIYIINLQDLSVQDLGSIDPSHYGSENWSDWGVLEYDGTDFYGLYRSWNGNTIVRHNFTTDTYTTFVDFGSSISDLSSFTISPWNNRWYFHYEGSTTLFGGTAETLGYAAAGSSSAELSSNGLGCYTEIEAVVNQIDLGEDITTCESNSPVVLFAGNGFQSYTWNGVNNNYNAFPVTESGTYIVVAVDASDCSITDTINVTFDPCLGLDDNESTMSAVLFPNPVTSRAKVEINMAAGSEVQLFVCDLNGKIVLEENSVLNSGYNSFDLDVSHLETGLYLLNLKGNRGNTMIRFVKQ